MWFRASAPGSLMLLGEYAVLHGGHALVAAVDHRMTVRLSPRNDSAIHITSQLGKLEIDLKQFAVQPPFQFLLTAIKNYLEQLPSGFNIIVDSEFSDQMGFASSAAVTVATLKVLHEWLQLPISNHDLILKARDVVRLVQGMGSGADVAACVLGGVVAYRAEPFSADTIPYQHPITVIYSGGKTKTADAIRMVNHYFSSHPKLFESICQAIDTCAQVGIHAAHESDHIELGKIMNVQQGLMDSLGVCTPILTGIIDMLRNDPAILGVKISGSGFGDCVIGLGEAKNTKRIHCSIDSRGLYCEKS